MADYKTPGVYVEEISTLPPSVGQVPTAIPAFVGYTEKAVLNGKSALMTPKHITSMLDYHKIFGGAFDFGEIAVHLDKHSSVEAVQFQSNYYLYNSVKMFFANGGGECYIVSVGMYGSDVAMNDLLDGVKTLEKEDHPTILACPDAMLLGKKEQAYSVQQAMLAQCNLLQDRVAILDVYDGFKSREGEEDVIMDFRNGIGVNHLKYGTSYYPWVQTTLSCDFGFENIQLKDDGGDALMLEELVQDTSAIVNLRSAIKDCETIRNFVSSPLSSGEEDVKINLSDKFFDVNDEQAGTEAEIQNKLSVLKDAVTNILNLSDTLSNAQTANELRVQTNSSSSIAALTKTLLSIDKSVGAGVCNPSDFPMYDLADVASIGSLEALEGDSKIKKAAKLLRDVLDELNAVLNSITSDSLKIKDNFDKNVFDTVPVYRSIVNEVQKNASLLPTAGCIAGVYAQVDSDRGVWKAPANVSLSSVVGPWIKLDNNQQEDLNVDVNAGKSINALRSFTGKGTLVWGARTLAGNDNEWRYVSVRRFFNMVEKSVKLSTSWAVFEPNDSTTWIRVKAMIENYLTNLWQAGALAGATPGAAFFVNIGLGTTMSQSDILEGRMNIEIGMAVVRPAEFIVLKFSHKLQES